MSYTLSYWIKEPTDIEFRFISKGISDEEYKRILNEKIIIGFKEGSIVRFAQLIEGEQVIAKKEKRVKQIPVKPYYRKERF